MPKQWFTEIGSIVVAIVVTVFPSPIKREVIVLQKEKEGPELRTYIHILDYNLTWIHFNAIMSVL